MHLFLQMSKLQETTSYFDENAGRVGVKSDTVHKCISQSTSDDQYQPPSPRPVRVNVNSGHYGQIHSWILVNGQRQ